jgi:hypothetical protein
MKKHASRPSVNRLFENYNHYIYTSIHQYALSIQIQEFRLILWYDKTR